MTRALDKFENVSLPKINKPFTFRAMNGIGRFLRIFGYGKGPISVEKLKETAAKQTGLSDFGAPSYHDGLTAYVASVNEQTNFHPLGRAIVEESIVRRLRSRLNTAESLKSHPELAETQLEKPVVIVGTARCGTTLLYNLMSLDSNLRSPGFWEVSDPMPPASIASAESVRKRIQKIQKGDVAGYNKLLPDHRQIHLFRSAEQKEECLHLMEPTFRFNTLGLLYGRLAGYMEWLDAQPRASIVEAYGEMDTLVRALMHGHEQRSWLSKSPGHAMHLPEMAEAFTDATFIHSHRNAVQRIVSHANLFYTLQSLFFDPMPSPADIGQLALEYNERSMEGIKRSREMPGVSERTHDIDYSELTVNPVNTISKLYDSMGREFSSEFESRLQTWLKDENYWAPRSVGKHKYDARTFHLDESQLAQLEP